MNETSFEAMRTTMVRNQLRTTGVNDAAVIEAMATVPRERFVSDAARAVAYADLPVPIGGGRHLLTPMVLGRLLTEAALGADERALVVAAGTGYSACVLATMGLKVVALEADAGLAARARTLAGDKVDMVEGPLEAGWPAGAPYDFILIDGAVEFVPADLVAQLAPGGRIVLVQVGADGIPRASIGRVGGGVLGLVEFADAPDTPLLPGFQRPRGFNF